MNEQIDKAFLNELLTQAAENPRRRMNYDLRTSAQDGSQRMLNALLPGTEVAIHRHPNSTETVICLSGVLDEVFFDASGAETGRIRLAPEEGKFGCQIPMGVWHTVEVFEPSVILEAKDGAYGEDGSAFAPFTAANRYFPGGHLRPYSA